MLTTMTEDDWTIVLQVFGASRSRRGDKGRDDRKFLEALHYFAVHNITWRALPAQFGHWNSVWKRFWRLSRAGTFEAFFDVLAAMSETAHLVQMFDSTVVRAHVSAAKMGLIGLARALASEFAAHNIRVNVVSPGSIDTRRDHPEWYQGRVPSASGIPLGRQGAVDEIASTCLFLVSDDGGFITGQTIHVNGGANYY